MRLLACLALLTLAGCVPPEVTPPPSLYYYFTPVEYDLALVGATVDGQRTGRISLGGSDSTWAFEDSTLAIVWTPSRTQIGFALANKTDRSVRIVWDDSAFINQLGTASRVIHEGVRLAERTSSQPPSIVPADGSVLDIVVPVERIEFTDYGEWVTNGIIQPDNVTAEDSTAAARAVGSEVGVLLALDVDGARREYTFTFEVTGYREREEF